MLCQRFYKKNKTLTIKLKKTKKKTCTSHQQLQTKTLLLSNAHVSQTFFMTEIQRESTKDELSINTPCISLDRFVRWSGSDSSGLKGKVGNPPSLSSSYAADWCRNFSLKPKPNNKYSTAQLFWKAALFAQQYLPGHARRVHSVWQYWMFLLSDIKLEMQSKDVFLLQFSFKDAKFGFQEAVEHTKCLHFTGPFSFLPGSWIHMRKKHKPSSQVKIHRMWKDWPYCTH